MRTGRWQGVKISSAFQSLLIFRSITLSKTGSQSHILVLYPKEWLHCIQFLANGREPLCNIGPVLRMLGPFLRQMQWGQARSTTKWEYSAKLVCPFGMRYLQENTIKFSLLCNHAGLDLSFKDWHFRARKWPPYILYCYWTSIFHSRPPLSTHVKLLNHTLSLTRHQFCLASVQQVCDIVCSSWNSQDWEMMMDSYVSYSLSSNDHTRCPTVLELFSWV